MEESGTPDRSVQTTVKTPLCRPGGKTQHLKTILPLIPEHRTYVEPFAGSAAVFFAKPPAEKSVLNDKDRTITDVLQFIKEGGRCPAIPMTKEKYNAILAKKDRTPCEQFALIKTSWGCNEKGFAPTKIPKGELSSYDFNKFMELMKTASVENKDFQEIVQKTDSPSTFFYLDPPYPSNGCQYPSKELCKITPQEVAATVQNIQGKALISYNDIPAVRASFKKEDGWTIKRIPAKWRINNTEASKNQDVKELLISNY